MTEKLCKDCKHHFEYYGSYICIRPIYKDGSLITGEEAVKYELNRFCENERRDTNYDDRCGVKGKYFEPRKSFWEGLSDWVTKSL